MTKLGGWVWYVTRRSRLDFGSGSDPDPASSWDTKRKLLSLAEICAQANAILVAAAAAVIVAVVVVYVLLPYTFMQFVIALRNIAVSTSGKTKSSCASFTPVWNEKWKQIHHVVWSYQCSAFDKHEIDMRMSTRVQNMPLEARRGEEEIGTILCAER